MSKRGDWLSFNSFRGGEQSDLPPHEIPDDALLKASNVLTDKRGRLAKRGPIQPYLLNESKASLQQVGVSKLAIGGAQPKSGFAVAGTSWYQFALPNPPTAKRAGNLLGAYPFSNNGKTITMAAPTWGPSFNSFGLCSFPLNNRNSCDPFVFFGGASANSGFSSSSMTASLTANNEQITVTGGLITNFSPEPGHIIYVSDNVTTTTKEYIGVITSVVSLNTVTDTAIFTVYPAPSQALTASGSGGVRLSSFESINGKLYESGGGLKIPAATRFACVHQNRIVAITSGTTAFSGSFTGAIVPTQNNTLSWSSITGESATAANTGADGILGMLFAGWPKSQQLTLDTSRVVGVVSLDANNLLVLCADKTLLISGVLGTVLPAGGVNTSSFNIRTVSAEIGCIDAESIQRTPLGVMFAGRDGVYITDGASFQNVMEGKVQQKWTVYDGTNSYTKNKVTGSALLKDTHYAIFTLNGPHFICDLYNDFSWTELEFENSNFPEYTEPYYVYAFPRQSEYDQFTYNEFGNSFDADETATTVVTQGYTGSDVWPRVFTNTGTQSNPQYAYGGTALPSASPTWITPPSQYDPVKISTDGTRIAASSMANATGGSAGSLAIWRKDGSTWVLEQALALSLSANLGRYMDMASVSANTIVVSDGASATAIYTRSGTTWSLNQTLAIPSKNVAVSSDGELVAVADTSYNTNVGRITILRKMSGVFFPLGNLNPPGVANEFIGTNLSFSKTGQIRLYATSSNMQTAGPSRVYVWSLISVSPWTITYEGAFAPKSGQSRIIGATGIGKDIYVAVRDNNSLYHYQLVSGVFTLLSVRQYNAINTLLTQWTQLVVSGDGKVVLIGDPKINTRSNLGSPTQTGGWHYYDTYAENGAKPVWGIGVHDWSGSSEVYAPRLNPHPDSLNASSDAIVLLDSILATDEHPECDANNCSPVLDATTTDPFNAKVTTKAFALGDPTQLKAYKSVMMTYSADAKNDGTPPVQIRFGESLNPNVDYTFLAYDEAPATVGVETQSHRTSLLPRPIDNGIAFGFNTTYNAFNDDNVGNGHFKLYEFFLNVTGLRKGRTIQ